MFEGERRWGGKEMVSSSSFWMCHIFIFIIPVLCVLVQTCPGVYVVIRYFTIPFYFCRLFSLSIIIPSSARLIENNLRNKFLYRNKVDKSEQVCVCGFVLPREPPFSLALPLYSQMGSFE